MVDIRTSDDSNFQLAGVQLMYACSETMILGFQYSLSLVAMLDLQHPLTHFSQTRFLFRLSFKTVIL